MFHSLKSLVGGALLDRLILLANHVIGAEPVAQERLRPHAGRCIEVHFSGWPAVLPPAPDSTFCITPAGLFERCVGVAPEPALRVSVDASNPAGGLFGAFTGRRPRVDVSGDAAFAADLNWLIDNVRWDVEDDLARLVGDAPAHEVARLARGVADGIRRAVRSVDALMRRRREAGDQ